LRGFKARRRRHRRHDDVGIRDGIGRRRREPRADRFARLLELRTFALRKQDIPRRDALDAGLAQARGDRLSGFAEADEAEAGGVSDGHVFSVSRARRNFRRVGSDVPPLRAGRRAMRRV